MKTIIIRLTGLLVLITSLSANATLIRDVNVSGKLLGASNVLINSILYDVRFVDGTCASVFSGCDDAADFLFQDSSSAYAAARELLDQVFLNVTEGDFDTVPGLINGCSTGVSECRVDTLFIQFIQFEYIEGAVAVNTSSLSDSVAGFGGADPSDDTSWWPDETYAVWSLSPPAHVPEPGTLALLSLGLAGVWRLRRR